MSKEPMSFLFGTRNEGKCNSESETGKGTNNPVKMSANDSFGLYFKAKKFQFKGSAQIEVVRNGPNGIKNIKANGLFNTSLSSGFISSMKEAYDNVCFPGANYYDGIVGTSTQTITNELGNISKWTTEMFGTLEINFPSYIEKKRGNDVEIWPTWSLDLSFGPYESGSSTVKRSKDLVETAIKVNIIPIKNGQKYTTILYVNLGSTNYGSQTLQSSSGEITITCEDEFKPE